METTLDIRQNVGEVLIGGFHKGIYPFYAGHHSGMIPSKKASDNGKGEAELVSTQVHGYLAWEGVLFALRFAEKIALEDAKDSGYNGIDCFRGEPRMFLFAKEV